LIIYLLPMLFIELASVNVINRGPFIWSRYLDY